MKNQIIYKLILLQAGCLWTNPYLRYGACFTFWAGYQYIVGGTEVMSLSLPLCCPFTLKDQYVMFQLNMNLRLLADEFFDCELHKSKPFFQLESSSWQLCLWELVLPISLTLACEYQGLEGWDHEQESKDTVWDFTVLTGNELRHKSERESVRFCFYFMYSSILGKKKKAHQPPDQNPL